MKDEENKRQDGEVWEALGWLGIMYGSPGVGGVGGVGVAMAVGSGRRRRRGRVDGRLRAAQPVVPAADGRARDRKQQRHHNPPPWPPEVPCVVALPFLAVARPASQWWVTGLAVLTDWLAGWDGWRSLRSLPMKSQTGQEKIIQVPYWGTKWAASLFFFFPASWNLSLISLVSAEQVASTVQEEWSKVHGWALRPGLGQHGGYMKQGSVEAEKQVPKLREKRNSGCLEVPEYMTRFFFFSSCRTRYPAGGNQTKATSPVLLSIRMDRGLLGSQLGGALQGGLRPHRNGTMALWHWLEQLQVHVRFLWSRLVMSGAKKKKTRPSHRQ